MSDQRVPLALRRFVAERGEFRCEYCRAPQAFSPSGFCVEHITPFVDDGKTIPENLALACAGCNGHKAGKTNAIDVVSKRKCRLFHPRTDRWSKHFAWSSTGVLVEGHTAVGRATVAALKLNRQSLVNLRRLLMLEGLHPPEI